MVNQYKSYICHKLGKIENLKIESIIRKKLDKNFIRVKIYAIGLNYVDYLMIKGTYQYKNSLPFTPGTEASGVIVEENCNNKNIINKRVIINTKNNCFSEEIIINLNDVFILDEKFKLNYLEAASFYMATLTSYISLIETIKTRKDNNILITGASGNIGQSFIQLSKYLGNKVISIVSNNKKKKLVNEIGSDYAIIKNDNIYKKIMQITKNKGVDTIIDINGFLKEYNLLKTLKWNGNYLILGFTDNNITSIYTNYILIKALNIYGIRAGQYLKHVSKGKKTKINKNIFDLAKNGIGIPKKYMIYSIKKNWG